MGGHVLFVEDEVDLRELIEDALTDLGYTVTVAGNGREALARLQGPLQFSHVVTDVSMPEGVSGLDVAAEAARAAAKPRATAPGSAAFEKAETTETPSTPCA